MRRGAGPARATMECAGKNIKNLLLAERLLATQGEATVIKHCWEIAGSKQKCQEVSNCSLHHWLSPIPHC